jgi:tetratricopeptide (TPR) repeat protein
MMRAGVLGLLVAALAACSGAAPPRPPAAVERAAEVDAEAHRALRDGDLVTARNLFEQSLRQEQSLDDLPGVATATLNLAAVYHRLNNDDMAVRLLDAIVRDAQVPYPAELRATAAFRKAVILVDGGAEGAAAAVEAAAALCGKSCAFTAGLENLRARMALRNKDYAAALRYARSAEGASGEDKQELANAWRNAAAAQAGAGRHDAALDRYFAALELDKRLAMPRHIADDLEGVSRELKQLGRNDEAGAYARRAAAAREALTGGAPGGAH